MLCNVTLLSLIIGQPLPQLQRGSKSSIYHTVNTVSLTFIPKRHVFFQDGQASFPPFVAISSGSRDHPRWTTWCGTTCGTTSGTTQRTNRSASKKFEETRETRRIAWLCWFTRAYQTRVCIGRERINSHRTMICARDVYMRKKITCECRTNSRHQTRLCLAVRASFYAIRATQW